MTDGEGQPEPTMEEILSSIRQIISDDDKESPAEEQAGRGAKDQDVTESSEPADGISTEVFDQDVEEFEENADQVQAISKLEAEEDEILELTELVPEDVSDIEEKNEVVMAKEKPSVAIKSDTKISELEEVGLSPSAADVVDDSKSEGLISREAAEQSTAAFAGFASAISNAQGVQLGSANRTLEELVKELLRPMLKDWLEINLQPIVARTVEREIAKLAGRADED